MRRTIVFEDAEWDEAFEDAKAQLEAQREHIARLETLLKETRADRDAEADRYLAEITRRDTRNRVVVTVLFGIAAVLAFSVVVMAEAMVWP